MWNNSYQLAFTNLKDALMQAPILYSDFSPAAKEFQLYTDASATGMGLYLSNMAMLSHIPAEHYQNQKSTTVSYKRNV